MPRPRLCRLIFRRLNATSRFKKSYFCPESDEPIHRRRFNDAHRIGFHSISIECLIKVITCNNNTTDTDGRHTHANGRYKVNNRQWSKSYNNVHIQISTAQQLHLPSWDATLGDVNVTITVGSLVICSVHIDLLIDANPIVDKCRQMRRWHTTWRCNRFSTQWEQTETETQPTAKRENTEMTKLDQRYSSDLFNQN
ncbi:hypothetical protein T08_10633 [Trichinella sp. T8]|nr:hypothetical protein T08_10633 [Trichinella sp. T8]